jgi:adenylate kinase family enzyme
VKRRDFSTLKDNIIKDAHEASIEASFSTEDRSADVNSLWSRYKSSLQNAQSTIPTKPKHNRKRWETSERTLNLVKQRAEQWDTLNTYDRKIITKEISRSARNDHRDYVDSILESIEKENSEGHSSEVFRLARSLSSKKGNSVVQPSVDLEGKYITSSEQQQEAWAQFLEKKFAARQNEPEVNLHPTDDTPEDVVDITLEEVKACIEKMKTNKSPGPDSIPAEQLKASDTATVELHHLLLAIWTQEVAPDDFVLADMLMHYKKKNKDDRSNYRALGMLNHSYKILAMVILLRILPYITPLLSDNQAGFRKGRGCRDNMVILMQLIEKLLEDGEDEAISRGLITYIDFTAAFDSIIHSYLFDALVQYGVPLKYCRLIKMIYVSALVRVRLQEPGGEKSYSRNVAVNRGVIQGDIPSPICFLVALDKLLKDHGNPPNTGIQVTDTLHLADLEYADDAAMPDKDASIATNRLTNFNEKANSEAGMSINIPKTKVQHIRKRAKVSETTEDDVSNLPAEKQFKHKCDKCDMTYPTKHGLSVHKGRWCKGRKSAKKPSRKGTVADRIISKLKVEKHQNTYDKVKIGNDELENVFTFNYLGAEIPGDGDPTILVKHRCDVSWGRFGDYRKSLMSAKLPVRMRCRLLESLVTSTMTYGCEAWQMTLPVKRMLNSTNSKQLSLITKRSIHEEAKTPTLNVLQTIKQRRIEYLGHILRMDPNRILRRFLLDLSPNQAPYKQGSLMSEVPYRTLDEMVEAADDKKGWRQLYKQNEETNDGESRASLGTARSR